MKTNITESDVEKVKNSTKIILEEDNIDLSYITIDLLSKPIVRLEDNSLLQQTYYGNRIFFTSDPQTAENLTGFYTGNNGQDGCGEKLMYISSALYKVDKQGECFGTNFGIYRFTHK